MRPEMLQDELGKILESTCLARPMGSQDEGVLSLTEEQVFQLWNVLGEELGIDLALATDDQRRLLFDSCQHGKTFATKDFGSLLWLVYYSDDSYQ